MAVSDFDSAERAGSVVGGSGNSDEACGRKVDNWHMMHPGVLQEEGPTGSSDSLRPKGDDLFCREVSGAEKDIIEADPTAISIKQDPALPSTRSDSSDSSTSISSEGPIEAELQGGNRSGSVSVPLERESSLELKDGHNDGTSPMHIPSTQMMERDGHYNPDRIPMSVFARNDPLTPVEWSTASNESLFSIHRDTNSFGRDQDFQLGAEMPKSLNFTDNLLLSPPLASDEPCQNKNVFEEGKLEEKEPSQDKMQENIAKAHNLEAKSPNASKLSHRSDVSDSSSFSFAFPILAPGALQSGSVKIGTIVSPRKRRSSEPNVDSENSISRPQPQQPPSKSICSSCFWCSWCSCLSCCSRLSFLSCCTRRSCLTCLSCWPCRP